MEKEEDFELMLDEADAVPEEDFSSGNATSSGGTLKQQLKTATISAAKDIVDATKEEIVAGLAGGERDIGSLAKKGLLAGISSYLSQTTSGRAVKRIFSGKSTLDDAWVVLDSVNPLFSLAHQILNNMRHGSCELLRYEDMITGILQNRPKDPSVVGCCVLQEKADTNTRVTFIYIDKNDEPVCGNGPKPYGFYLLTKSFDDELIRQFDGKDMLVVK